MLRRSCIMAATLALTAVLSGGVRASELTDSLKKGTLELKSATALAFGPEGILFVGDPATASIHAIGTGDVKGDSKEAVKVEKLADTIASMLGTTGSEVTINDFKVNPASGNLYFSVTRGKGTNIGAVIVKLDRAGKFTTIELKDVPFASVKLPNASEKSRTEAITGLAYVNGKLFVSGLSNEEFASNLRSIAFPFKEASKGSSVEIFHGAHGAFETRSPVRTFTAYEIAGQTNLLAAYTCTPLVLFPVETLKPGEKVRGTTVAELGNGNRPLDMIVYKKDGKDYLLLANNKRGVMKIKLEGIEKIEAITKRAGPKTGAQYDTIDALKDVVQLDKLDADRAVTLNATGTLETVPLP
ncbi:MAG: hypothetical protein K8T89_19045 [Planctomycetes bacterium]|nr:hypothetical protein [Planctomycetota bacterium]